VAQRKVSTGLKMGLELGPVAAFFAGYLWLRDRVFTIGGTEYEGFIVVTAAFVPLMLLATGVLWALTGTLSRMQLVTVVLVVVFGGLSVVLNDDAFFKMKPTIIYILFAAVLGFGLMRGQSYLADLLGGTLRMRPEGWMILTRRITMFFLVLAIANEAVWRLMSTDAWVNFKTFGLTAALFAFFMTQGALLERHALPDEDAGEG
jgi:intracellular septation protein